MSLPATVVKVAGELVSLLGERAVVALLRRLLDSSREAQLKANYEAGKSVFKRRTRR